LLECETCPRSAGRCFVVIETEEYGARAREVSIERRRRYLLAALAVALLLTAPAQAAPKPVKPLAGEFPVLVILQCFKDTQAASSCGATFAAAQAATSPLFTPSFFPLTLANPDLYERILFGLRPSTRDFFLEQSYGAFSIKKAGVLGWYVAPKPEGYYFGNPPSEGCRVCDGTTHHAEKYADAIKQADRDFDFAGYDTDKDGTVETDELAIIILPAHGTDFVAGERRASPAPVLTDCDPMGDNCTAVDGWIVEIYAFGAWFSRFAHELAHVMRGPTNLDDLYLFGNDFKQVDEFTLMGLDQLHPHLDPWHKWKLGWLTPTVVKHDGRYTVADSETNPQAYLLRDPCHGPQEYFLVENRWPGSSYDADLPAARGIPSRGLAIWHIDESKTNMREVITLERARNDAFSALALWRRDRLGATSYAFNDRSAPRNARWNDGRHSRIEIKDFSPAGPTMSVTFVTPEGEYDALVAERDRVAGELADLEGALADVVEILADLRGRAGGAIARVIALLQERIAQKADELVEANAAITAFCTVPSGPPGPEPLPSDERPGEP
jgi:M6 family metalloprotease-like protein